MCDQEELNQHIAEGHWCFGMRGANVDYGWLYGFIMAGLISWRVFGHVIAGQF